MKKRALYYCRINRDDKANIGLVRKCLGQVKGLKAAGYEVDMVWLCNRGVLFNDHLLIRTWFDIKPHTWKCYVFYYFFLHLLLKRRLPLNDYQLFFGRYELAHPMLLSFLRKFRRLNKASKMVVEIPTYPYERQVRGALRQLQYLIDRIWRQRLKHCLDLLLTPGNFTHLFGLPVLTLPNGVDTGDVPVADWQPKKGVLRLVGTGHWQQWHGLERIVNGLEIYYRQKNAPLSITVHLVGATAHVPWLGPAIREKALEPYFQISPPADGKSLDAIFQEADLAIGVLGNGPERLHLAYPLKHREYACRGVPFIYSLPDPGLEGLDACLVRLPEDDSPVDFNLVLEKWKNMGRECRERLRRHAVSNFSWERLMERFAAALGGEDGWEANPVGDKDQLPVDP